MDMVTLPLYITVFLFGITVGSFLNVCILRIPAGESIVTVPSHCTHCGGKLRWWELIPLFSYIFLGGRCARCKGRISPQYPAVEAANGLLWCVVFYYFGAAWDLIPACLFCSALLVIAVIDARTREIPPGLNIFILCLGLIRLVLHLADWPLYVIGFFAVSLPLYLLLRLSGGRAIGGGDVKLMAAAGLFLGWKNILFAFLAACVIGSVIHLTLMAAKKAGRVLAMGPYLAAGCFTALLWGERLIEWYLSQFSI